MALCDRIGVTYYYEKSAQRDANTAHALAVVRFGHRLPARPLSQTHRQDILQYTAPQVASAQCNYAVV